MNLHDHLFIDQRDGKKIISQFPPSKIILETAFHPKKIPMFLGVFTVSTISLKKQIFFRVTKSHQRELGGNKIVTRRIHFSFVTPEILWFLYGGVFGQKKSVLRFDHLADCVFSFLFKIITPSSVPNGRCCF
jgi:hypothetical protein